jgi:hypothetical protein
MYVSKPHYHYWCTYRNLTTPIRTTLISICTYRNLSTRKCGVLSFISFLMLCFLSPVFALTYLSLRTWDPRPLANLRDKDLSLRTLPEISQDLTFFWIGSSIYVIFRSSHYEMVWQVNRLPCSLYPSFYLVTIFWPPPRSLLTPTASVGHGFLWPLHSHTAFLT